jgi:dimeric dUTPase (all-alpha-NTP-PPase superfamily)
MNLTKLFETQKALRDRIDYNEPDRFTKLSIALLVELGECLNEWRGFKFWSKDQKPRTHKARHPYMDIDDADFYNPLLDEFVDGLHFLLELGIELGYEPESLAPHTNTVDINIHILNLYFEISDLGYTKDHNDYVFTFRKYLGLGELLGFSQDEIVQAYFAKNKINHIRQDTGY